MQVKFKGDVVFTSQNPQDIMEYLASSIQMPCAPDYLDRIPVTAAIVDLLFENTDYQVPHIDFFSFLEHHRALRAFLEEFSRQNPDNIIRYLDMLEQYNDLKRFVSSCFDWKESKEGFLYWEFVDTLWREECNATVQ